MKDAANSQIFRDLHKHRGVPDINDLPGLRLSDIQRKPKDVGVGFADMNKAGGNKLIHKSVQFEFLNPILVQFASCIADCDNLQSAPNLELSD